MEGKDYVIEHGDVVQDRLRLSRPGRAINDRELVRQGCTNRVALIDVGMKRHDDPVTRTGLRTIHSPQICLERRTTGGLR